MSRLPRTLGCGKIIIPCNLAFILKKIDTYDQSNGKFSCLITLKLRIKCTGLEPKGQIMNYL